MPHTNTTPETTNLPSATRRPVPDPSWDPAYADHHTTVCADPRVTDIDISARYTGHTSTDEGATWTPVPMPTGWDTVCGGHVQAEALGSLLTGWDVTADGTTRTIREGDGTLARWTLTPGLVSDVELPDYLNAPAVHHGVLPSDRDRARTPLARTARTAVAQALAILNDAGVKLAAYTESTHCVGEGAHLDSQTFKRENRVNVVIDLATAHFDHLLNPRNHPGYPALRQARVVEAARWADLFRSHGWTVREGHDTTPGRLALVLTPPSM